MGKASKPFPVTCVSLPANSDFNDDLRVSTETRIVVSGSTHEASFNGNGFGDPFSKVTIFFFVISPRALFFCTRVRLRVMIG